MCAARRTLAEALGDEEQAWNEGPTPNHRSALQILDYDMAWKDKHDRCQSCAAP